MVKPRHHQIDWKGGFEAIILDAPDARAVRVLKRAQLALQKDPLHILTSGFLMRCEGSFFEAMANGSAIADAPILPEDVDAGVFQIEHTIDAGPAEATIVYVEPPYIVTFPLPTGGFMMFDTETSRYYIPSGFNYERGDGAVGRYMGGIAASIKSYEFVRRLPVELSYKDVPAARVVRRGKTVKQGPYRVVTERPGLDREIVRAVRERTSQESTRRAPPVEHGVEQHWVRYGLDPTCTHNFEDITTEEVLKREHCTKCHGKRTLRKAFKRGDPTKVDPRRRLIIVK